MAEFSNPLDSIPTAPPDSIFGVLQAFREDKNPEKINLSVGAYRTNEGKPFVLECVREAEKRLVADDSLNKEYLPIDGLAEFRELSAKLAYGDDHVVLAENRLAIAQSISGTGALRLGAEFIKKFFPENTQVYLSEPTWGNHNKIFGMVGIKANKYTYFNPQTLGLDFEGMLRDLDGAPAGSVILLHACAHNPTGVDPTRDQWEQLADFMKKKNLFPFFDCAYQGFATGDLLGDAWSFRMFAARGLSLILSQSYAKNLGLYAERVGTLSVVCGSEKVAKAVQTQLKAIVRALYSNPPRNGAYIVAKVLSTPDLREKWLSEVKMMADRIRQTREMLVSELKRLGTPGDWSHITSQIGMFSYTGLSAAQVTVMQNEFHIYLTSNGRISMAGINTGNVALIAKGIDAVVRRSQSKI